MRIDARIPVVFAPVPAGSEDLMLTEGEDFAIPDLDPALHVAGCTCCTVRSPVAGLLGGLFFARARGTVPFFRRVVVATSTPAGRDAMDAALADDPVVSGCYRLAG